MSDLRFPIGKFSYDGTTTAEQRRKFLDEIEQAPAQLRAVVAGLSEHQLDTPYRDGGWTVRQLVHHVPDSHMNSYVRFKLAMTEDNPTIKPYMEGLWAELPEAKSARSFVNSARNAAPSVDAFPPHSEAGRLEAHAQPSGDGSDGS